MKLILQKPQGLQLSGSVSVQGEYQVTAESCYLYKTLVVRRYSYIRAQVQGCTVQDELSHLGLTWVEQECIVW